MQSSQGTKRAKTITSKKPRKSRKVRKTLTAAQRRAVATAVLVETETKKFAAAGDDDNRSGADAIATSATSIAAPLPEIGDPLATRNLKKAWTKSELSTLAQLAEDANYLRQLIPTHPPGEIDWDIVSLCLGRYSKGGAAVKQQFYTVVRLLKEARREGKKGSSYVDLIVKAFKQLSDQSGTVYDLQKLLKGKEFASHLDKYKSKSGTVRWKEALRQTLTENAGHYFEIVGKSATGKNIWKLKGEALVLVGDEGEGVTMPVATTAS